MPYEIEKTAIFIATIFFIFWKNPKREWDIQLSKSGQKNTIFTGNSFLQKQKMISIIDKYLLSLIEQTFDLHFQCIIIRPICSEPNFS